MKKLNLGLLLLLLLLLLISCDSQSPNARYIDEDGMSVNLFDLSGLPLPALDLWWVKYDDTGSEIYSAAFGYTCTIAVDGVEVNGIKVICEVISHDDPTGGDYDIWDKIAPSGKKYGFVSSQPPGSWDYETGIATSRTFGDGECSFIIGLGSPMPHLLSDFDWPGGCGTMVSTMVEVKFVIPKWDGNNIEKECYMYFIRAQCQDFWEPFGGVIGNSYSTVEKWDGIYSMAGEGITIQLERIDSIPKVKKKKDKIKMGLVSDTDPSAGLPIRKWAPPTTLVSSPTSPILPFASAAEPSGSWEYIEGHLRQFVFGWGVGWHWVSNPENLVVLWMADPCDYQDGVDLVSHTEPYAFFCTVSLEGTEEVNTYYCTVTLKSKDEFGNDAAWLPINMYVYAINPPYVYLFSNGVVALEHTAGQGYYIDYWGWPVAAIYVPDNGYLEIEADGLYGDFNFDGAVNFVDYTMLLKQMGKGLTDENYNLMYDGDHDGRTTLKDLAIFFRKEPRVNFVDFAKFAGDWLNGDDDFNGLDNFYNEWLKPPHQNWLKIR